MHCQLLFPNVGTLAALERWVKANLLKRAKPPQEWLNSVPQSPLGAKSKHISGRLCIFPTSPSSRRTPLGRGSDGRFGLRRFRAKHKTNAFGTRRAFTHAPATLLRAPFCPFASVALFFLAAARVKEKTSRHRQKGKTMKLEEIKNKTNEAVSYLVAALEFGNVMLIARQRAVT